MTTRKFERRVCDRCGFTTEVKDDPKERKSWGWARLGEPLPDGKSYVSIFGEMPPIADLCPDCREAFIGWWREAKKC
jgi:hypothetical protein